VECLRRDGVSLAYKQSGSGTGALVFVHGWCCNHTHFVEQLEHFTPSRQVVAVDLRGHGASDRPQQEYTLAGFASDVAWMCEHLQVRRPLIVGHSMGGAVAIELASRYPDLPRGIMLMDTLLLPPPDFLQALESVPAALRSPDAPAVIEQLAGSLFLSTDDPGRRTRLIAEMRSTSTEVAYSAFMAHTVGYDPRPAIGSVRVPAAYVRSMPFMSDLNRLQDAWPRLMIAHTLGSGHFAMLEVPKQINAMIERFASLLP
jgi:pimeloyl-ACP methyl ester carboxylesterase